jgi:hypothetical protein
MPEFRETAEDLNTGDPVQVDVNPSLTKGELDAFAALMDVEIPGTWSRSERNALIAAYITAARRLLAEVESRGRAIEALSARIAAKNQELDHCIRASLNAGVEFAAKIETMRVERDRAINECDDWETKYAELSVERDAYRRAAPEMPRPPAEEGCTCFPTDPSTWTTYGSAVEPGSMYEPNPECPEHGAHTEIVDEPDLSLIPAKLIVRDPEICSGRPTMRGTRILASRIAGELAAGTTWEQLHEWYPSMPVPAPQPPSSAAGAVPESTGRGTGAVEAPGGAQGGSDA